jgi:hypothetical protein
VIQDEDSAIQIREPYYKSEAFQDELLTCMAWSDSDNEYSSDGSCAFSLMEDQLPCDDCEGNEVTLEVSNCRCTHLSVFAVAFEETSPGEGLGPTIGIYSDFFALI